MMLFRTWIEDENDNSTVHTWANLTREELIEFAKPFYEKFRIKNPEYKSFHFRGYLLFEHEFIKK